MASDADASFTLTFPAEISIPWGTETPISANYSVETALLLGTHLRVTVQKSSADAMLTNAEMQAAGFSGIPFSEIQNSTVDYPPRHERHGGFFGRDVHDFQRRVESGAD